MATVGRSGLALCHLYLRKIPSDLCVLRGKKVKVVTRPIFCISALTAVEGWARSRWTASMMMDEDADSSRESRGNLASAHSAMTPLVAI